MSNKISSLVKSIHLSNTKFGSSHAEFVLAAAENALYFFGDEIIENTTLINFIGLRMSFKDNIIVHEVTEKVSTIIAQNIVDTCDSSLPDMLPKSFIIESKDDSVPMFDNIYSIGGYWIENFLTLVVNTIQGTCVCSVRYNPDLSFFEIAYWTENGPVLPNVDNTIESCIMKAISFVITFTLLNNLEKKPFETKRNKKHSVFTNKRTTTNPDWIVNRVYIDGTYQTTGRILPHKPMTKIDKLHKEVTIKSFTRRQRVGKGRTKVVEKVIQSFISHRWTKKGDRKVIVSTRQTTRPQIC